MKIAFIGKGGSGKTTLSGLFIQNLLQKKKKVLAVDADINVGLGDVLGIPFKRDAYISRADITKKIQRFLIGKNKKILSEKHFIHTTPPGTGSQLLTFQEKEFFTKYCSYLDDNLKFFHVGTYEKEDIGVGCYHGSLAILENMLAHTVTKKDEYVIADMVAGNDCFAGALHALFNLIFLIVEPSKESIEVAKKFLSLALQSETVSPIALVYNKIEDAEDIAYLQKNGLHSDFSIPYDTSFKGMRRKGKIELQAHTEKVMNTLEAYARKHGLKDQNIQLQNLYTLHHKAVEQEYIRLPLGDLSYQIDGEFKF